MELKQCNHCKEIYPITKDYFYFINKRGKLKPMFICISCAKIHNKKHYNKKYMNNYRNKCKKLGISLYSKNKEKIISANKKYINKLKECGLFISSCYGRNRTSREREKENRENLTDTYIIGTLTRYNNLSFKDIKQYPELIESKRLQIQLLRTLKNKTL